MAVHVPLSQAAQDEAREHDALDQQPALAVQRRADRRADAGHGARLLLPDRSSARLAEGAGRRLRQRRTRRILAYQLRRAKLDLRTRRSRPAGDDPCDRIAERRARLERACRDDRRPDHLQRGRCPTGAALPATTLDEAAALQELVADCYRQLGTDETAEVVDDIKNLGFRLRHARRHDHRRERHHDAGREGRAASRRPTTQVDDDRAAVPARSDHRGGALRRRSSTIWTKHQATRCQTR